MIKKAGHICLSLILIIATVGITLNLHYCQDKIYDIGFLSEAEACCSVEKNESTKNHCHHHNHCSSESQHQNSCEDETFTTPKVDDYVVSSFQFSFSTFTVVDLFPATPDIMEVFNGFIDAPRNIPDRNHIPIEIQTFLSLLQTYLL
ncbi:MAG: hypothetical protein GVY19_11260 [Bacteroidetes bacterium]|jgi:hypothetical protein|nr:hypothetical protein [Bacteroidota bacterium]